MIPGSRVVPGRYPAVGTDEIADRIRERRGARGLTDLDGALLHVPPIADGWNSLLGAVRTKGHLPGDVRELLILRVAAVNHAAYEWIHHEPVGRNHGLTTEQLVVIRDTSQLPNEPGVLDQLQTAALAFADVSTKAAKVPPETTKALQDALFKLVSAEERAQDLLVEAAAVVATYNMVSRFLLAVDVAGLSDEEVPWPVDRVELKVPLTDLPESYYLNVVTLTRAPSLPWIVLCNSLLTNISMWDPVLPHLLSLSFNIILHDQRGHGRSSVPLDSPCTIPILAQDIAYILDHLNIPKVHAVIGVSQGGATALSFLAQFPERTHFLVACDTSPRTAPGNKEAWQQRIDLAKEKGMGALANVTASRWFAEGSQCYPGTVDAGLDLKLAGRQTRRAKLILDMIEQTSVDGFALGASALMDYDLLDPSPGTGKRLLDVVDTKTLLVAGSLDAGGKIAQGLGKLRDDWNIQAGKSVCELAVVDGAGHLPMVDETVAFFQVAGQFLKTA